MVRTVFLIKTLDAKFGKEVMKASSPKMLGMSKFLIVRPIDDTEKPKSILVWKYDVPISHKTLKV